MQAAEKRPADADAGAEDGYEPLSKRVALDSAAAKADDAASGAPDGAPDGASNGQAASPPPKDTPPPATDAPAPDNVAPSADPTDAAPSDASAPASEAPAATSSEAPAPASSEGGAAGATMNAGGADAAGGASAASNNGDAAAAPLSAIPTTTSPLHSASVTVRSLVPTKVRAPSRPTLPRTAHGCGANTAPTFRAVAGARRQNAGSIIGRGGSVIRSIREDSTARVNISETIVGAPDRIVTVTGNALAVAKAFYLIALKLDEARQVRCWPRASWAVSVLVGADVDGRRRGLCCARRTRTPRPPRRRATSGC